MIWLTLFAHAEDDSDLDGHGLLPSTDLFVDVQDASAESFVFTGTYAPPSGDVLADIEVFAPDGSFLGTFASGDEVLPVAGAGTYRVEPISNGNLDGNPGEDPMVSWSLVVTGAPAERGRVWSRRWALDGGGFGEANGLDGRFFAVVGGGSVSNRGLVELRTEGLTGFVYAVIANAEGIDGGNARSQPDGTGPINDRLPMYLRPPDGFSASVVQPALTDVDYTAPACGGVVPGLTAGELSFTSNVVGHWHLVCDADGDGVRDVTGDGDLHLFGEAGIGDNNVSIDGAMADGELPGEGLADCELWLTVGDFHYLAQDIETSYPGLRMFEVADTLERTGLPMYFDDRQVQSDAVVMPNGQISDARSGPDGLHSGTEGAPAVANDNARGWGNFTVDTKGDDNVLDTWTVLRRDVSLPFDVAVLDSEVDSDGDGLPDAAEVCTTSTDPGLADSDGDGLSDAVEVLELGTDPNAADGDGDGIPDGDEIGDPSDPRDSDEDGIIDANDPDDDGDGVPTLVEGTADFDGDGIPDHQDFDDDNDGVPTALEAPGDTDLDGMPDRTDTDDDGDGTPTEDEDRNGNGNRLDDNADGDTLPDFLDPDDDDDGIPSIDEAPGDFDGDGLDDVVDPDDDDDGVPSGVEGLGDVDGDGQSNHHDVDDDGDGIPTSSEDRDGDGDPTNDDADGDGVPDFLESDDDGDGLPTNEELDEDTDGDGTPNAWDPDDDGDGIDTLTETSDTDTDGDGLLDYLDVDDDGDGLDTIDEGQGDADGDGIPDHLEADSDGDGLDDGIEGTGDYDGDGVPDFADPDDDGDGVPTADEAGMDSDGDGLDDDRDADDDDDGVPTASERDGDTDGDGQIDRLDTDDDGDGIPTSEEIAGDRDVDADGNPNWVDTDADGDGLSDAEEGTGDLDGDGVPDFLDPDGAVSLYYKGSGLGCSTRTGSAGTLLVGLTALFVRRRQ